MASHYAADLPLASLRLQSLHSVPSSGFRSNQRDWRYERITERDRDLREKPSSLVYRRQSNRLFSNVPGSCVRATALPFFSCCPWSFLSPTHLLLYITIYRQFLLLCLLSTSQL
ncbi:hypothetical protein P153DRAFT_175572 [Dothidotthia symphoricarpi CBS 119687]|uniref:Uncharacterized protein n=1 Tax=Dothidotthia symphoricarpi CBS 119687 TaxID=1392245 RepID=A0A6A6ANV3_9PLEO|nr:uncharacterized protein P153DRAFT_175572 [Dothidotthia symphoricarpi CBS 119687]KAF2132873.1 hypothetical protein P153DRAFT_175572 [Dothidotthia symphoricarpi CBS 119687]